MIGLVLKLLIKLHQYQEHQYFNTDEIENTCFDREILKERYISPEKRWKIIDDVILAMHTDMLKKL